MDTEHLHCTVECRISEGSSGRSAVLVEFLWGIDMASRSRISTWIRRTIPTRTNTCPYPRTPRQENGRVPLFYIPLEASALSPSYILGSKETRFREYLESPSRLAPFFNAVGPANLAPTPVCPLSPFGNPAALFKSGNCVFAKMKDGSSVFIMRGHPRLSERE